MSMKNMTIANIAKACGGTLVNADSVLDKEIEGAVIDSRLIEKNFLFFAYKGEKSDGHDYILAAFEKGALAVVCEHANEEAMGACIVVENTLKALKDIAEFYRSNIDAKVIGITGSVGKTTTKEFIAAVLSKKYDVLKTEGNFNNQIGLPLTILKIRDNHEVAVLEMGISEFGEMRNLSKIAKPDVCVITNIGECHLEKLGTRDGVLKAKTEIFEYMNPEGKVFLNGDDDKLITVREVNGNKPVFFGLSKNNEIYPSKTINRGLWGSECSIENGDGTYDISIPLPGKHMIINTLAAAAIAKELDVPYEDVVAGIGDIKAVSGRTNIIQKNSLTIIDDCYNANPVSMKASLDLLTEAVTRKVAILGDMFELGENETALHEEVGKYAADKKIEKIVCIGTRSKHMYDKAMAEASLSVNLEACYFVTVDEALENLSDIVKKGDSVLVKASNSMKFSRIVEALCEDGLWDDKKKSEKENVKADKTADKEALKNIEDTETETDKGTDAKEAVEDKENTKENAVKKVVKVDDSAETGKKVGLIVAIGVVIAVIVLVSWFVVTKTKYNKAVRGEIVVSETGEIYHVTSTGNKLLENAPDMNSEDYNIQTDGKYFYYDDEFGLRWSNANGNKSDVAATYYDCYDILDKGIFVYYASGQLKKYDVAKGEKSLLCENVQRYTVNEKKNAIVYLTDDAKLWYLEPKNPESLKLIDDNVINWTYADKKLKTMVYFKNDGLYCSKNHNAGEILATDATGVWVTDEERNLKIYYITAEGTLYFTKPGKSKGKKVCDNVGSIIGAWDYSNFVIMTKDNEWRLVSGKKAYDLEGAELGYNKSYIGYDKKAKKIFFLDKAENDKVNLYGITCKGTKKGNLTVEDTNVLTVEFFGEGHIFIGKNGDNGTIDLYENGVLVARNIETGSVKKTEYGDDIVFAYQVSDQNGFYELALYDGTEVSDIGSTVSLDYVPLSKKKIYFLQKSNENMFDVVLYNGKKIKTVTTHVDMFDFLQY